MNQKNKGEFGIHTLEQVDGERYAKGFNIAFDNGLELSIQFGLGNYCENKKEVKKEPYDDRLFQNDDDDIIVKSKTAEIAIFNGDESFTEEIFGDDVLKYKTPNELIGIMQKVAEWRPEK